MHPHKLVTTACESHVNVAGGSWRRSRDLATTLPLLYSMQVACVLRAPALWQDYDQAANTVALFQGAVKACE